MNATRPPAVAGAFYPADPSELIASVDAMLDSGKSAGPAPKVIIAPHAGHVYSGSIAAQAYSRLKDAKSQVSRVVLLGPSHRVSFKGIAASSVTAYRTPLGEIPVDSAAVQQTLKFKGTGFLDEAHAEEHSLEVQLPFLQRILGAFSLVPLVVGDAGKEEVAAILSELWGGPETLIVISTDLSHFHPYAEASKIDANTSSKILALDASLGGEEACGCRPLNGLLHLLKIRELKVEQILVRNSGDTAGTKDRVVGYGAYIVVEKTVVEKTVVEKRRALQSDLPLAWRQQLLQVARNAISSPFDKKENDHIELGRFPQAFAQERATFVTLNIKGQLRGCIGSLVAHRPLVVDVAQNAQAAAFKDPRFNPLTFDEYQSVDIHISVLSRPEPISVESREDLLLKIRPGVDGLILEENGHRATYLPSVWEQIPEPERFVAELRKKAGLSSSGWESSTTIHRYTTEEFC